MDCEALRDRLADDTSSAVADAAEASCEALRLAAPGALEAWKRSVAPELVTTLDLATPAGSPCPITTAGDPPAVSAFGGPAARCAWDAALRVEGGDSARWTITWWAEPL